VRCTEATEPIDLPFGLQSADLSGLKEAQVQL